MSVLNATLAPGITTFSSFRRGVEVSSIIDLFLTNISTSSMVSPSLTVASDLSLGSDHRLMTLSFDLVSDGSLGTGHSLVLAPRRLWNLSRLAETEPLALFQSRFRSLVAPLRDTLAGLVDCPPASCPSIDSLNESLNNCLYQAMDESSGSKAPGPGHWKKYVWGNCTSLVSCSLLLSSKQYNQCIQNCRYRRLLIMLHMKSKTKYPHYEKSIYNSIYNKHFEA